MELTGFLMAFCGGIFGASIGALASFIFVGFSGLVGIAVAMAGGSFDFLNMVTFGSVFGPHIALIGGVAAGAYARKRGYIESGKDITLPMLSLKKPDVLLVAGVFGVIGYVMNALVAGALPGQIDSVGATVFGAAIIAKVAFGDLGLREVFGIVPEEVKALGGRFSENAPSWVPYMVSPFEKLLIGFAAGGLSAYITVSFLQIEGLESSAVFVGFLLSAASLIFLQMGFPIPVTHHITVCASYAALASGGNLYWGIVFGVAAAFLGDFASRLFYNYGDTHIDPPATAIMVLSYLAMGILPNFAFYQSGDTIPLAILGLGFFPYSVIRTIKGNKAEGKQTIQA